MTRRRDLVIVAVSVAIAVVALGAWFVGRDSGDAGDAAAVERRLLAPETPADVAATAPSVTAATGTTSTTTTTAVPLETSVPEEEPPTPLLEGRFTELPTTATPDVVPVGLTIDRIAVDAPVISVGVDLDTLEMEVPDNVTDVAWYEFGSRPGDAGSAVLAAHVDLFSQGPGVFFELNTLEPGDEVTVDFSDGSSQSFRVEARATYDKDELPLDAIFAREGDPILTLITCGGGFNRSIGSYDSNVVVYASPIGEATVPAG